jgi:hypothetical protein
MFAGVNQKRRCGILSKPTSAVKRRYNKASYHRYEFSVGLDTKLNYLLENFMGNSGNSLSALIKDLLCQHFGVGVDEIYVPFHIRRDKDGNWAEVPNDGLLPPA